MPLQATSGAASYDAFGGGVPVVPAYIEEVFSTYLYTGNGSTQTITNGIDLSTKGGLVWLKYRTDGGANHIWTDTVRGATKSLYSNATDAQATVTQHVTGFTTSGFSVGNNGNVNDSGGTFASWTFRKAPKFFDVVTYTGNSVAGREIAHNLGSVPGCMIVKSTSDTQDWAVYHRSLGNTKRLVLNGTDAEITSTVWNNTTPTSTVFTVSDNARVNSNGSTYVAYIYAHDAGGFGLTGTDNVISCGSYTGNGSATGPVVTLGYEPQWVMVKRATGTANGNWVMLDVMRGFSTSTDNELYANLSLAEGSGLDLAEPQATGFQIKSASSGVNASGSDYIYIAIRRGPMKVPTSGTSVFSAQTGTYSAGDSLSVGFPADMYIDAWRTGTLYKANYSRLVNFANSNSSASQNYLKTNTTDAEVTTSQAPSLYDLWNTTAKVGSWNAGVSEVWWMFKRAPSFFDEVCYTGTGSQLNVNHNLGSVPELIIVKNRNKSGGENWAVYSATLGAGFFLWLNATDSVRPTYDAGRFPVAPTSSVFTVGSDPDNGGSFNYVAYLFATCAGVSKVGSYTGTGALQTVNCGFAAGARFVLIKRTDSTGDWFVWDSARGISSGNDPYLLLNSAAAEVTGTNYVDTTSVGFQVTAAAPAGLNANGGTYIFLAIA